MLIDKEFTPRRGFFHEYTTPNGKAYREDHRIRHAAFYEQERKIIPDLSRPALCQHGAEFLDLILEQHPTLGNHPQLHELDQAVLTIVYLSRYRLQFLTPCSLYWCINNVATELLDLIAATRDELKHNPAGTAQSAHLYLGEAMD